MSERFAQARDTFFAALTRLEEVIAAPESPFLLDAAIQRFEFTYEAAWRALKRAGEDRGLQIASPRQAFEAGMSLGLIADDGAWTAMLKERNLTTHTYKEDVALGVFSRLPTHLVHFQNLRTALAALPDLS